MICFVSIAPYKHTKHSTKQALVPQFALPDSSVIISVDSHNLLRSLIPWPRPAYVTCIMAIANKQQETGTSNQVLEPVKPQIPVLDEISSFHETLETERVHRVLVKWRKRKRDEEVSTGTAILEKILRTLHDEVESRKERSELWDKALMAELKPDRARMELDSRIAASALSPEKQTQVVQAVGSVLNIEISGEELGKMLSKPKASKASTAEPPRAMPPTPPADQHSSVTSHNMRPPDVDTHTREPDSRRPPVAPRVPLPPSGPASRRPSRDDYTTYSQSLRPQGSGDVSSCSLPWRIHLTDTLVQEDKVSNSD